MLIGMAKMGVPGVGLAAVPLLVMVFGGKQSSGALLIIMCMADILAVIYYHRHANWPHLIKLLPAAVVGVLLGTAVGDYIDDEAFKMVMAGIILASVALVVFSQKIINSSLKNANTYFAVLLGVLGGFTSMIGNLAGPIMALYLLAMRFPKNQFIGTSAWFFLILNLIKVPFHIFVWKTIYTDIFYLDLLLSPFIILGAVLGAWIVKKFSELWFKWFVIIATILASFLMLF